MPVKRILSCSLLALLIIAGCGGDGPGGTDGGVGGTGGDMGDAGTGGGDGGVDASLACDEVPALGGELGGQCRGDTFDCNGDLICLAERTDTIGGVDDPIVDFPGPGDSFDVTTWRGDMCTLPLTASPTICTLEDAQACAQICGICTPAFIDADICLRGCRAEDSTNSTCRDGYECDLLFDVCDVGCTNDADCRVFREDTNQNGEFDPGEPLVYDVESTFVCDQETYRCEHPGTVGAEAGDPCVDDWDCEENGVCLDEDFFGWPGGSCSKIRCDLVDCAGNGLCSALGLGVPLCGQECEVGLGAMPPDTSTYLGNTQGCRDGYTCFWQGGNDTVGACVPGEFNAVTTNNVGTDCTESSECYSPFGQGACGDPDLVCAIFGGDPGTCQTGFGCTVFDCAVPGMPDDVCGADAECIVNEQGLSWCAAKCASAENCLPGAACIDLDGDELTLDTVCLPFCLTDTECRAGETCSANGECTAPPP